VVSGDGNRIPLRNFFGAEPEVAADPDGAAPAVDAADGAGEAAAAGAPAPAPAPLFASVAWTSLCVMTRGGFEVMIVADS